jgi:hypothetical protein
MIRMIIPRIMITLISLIRTRSMITCEKW